MNIDLPEGSLDLLYTNCVDHAFDLEKMMSEHARVLKASGFLLYDMGINMEEGKGGPFEAVSWDRTEDLVVSLLGRFHKLIRSARDEQFGGQWLERRPDTLANPGEPGRSDRAPSDVGNKANRGGVVSGREIHPEEVRDTRSGHGFLPGDDVGITARKKHLEPGVAGVDEGRAGWDWQFGIGRKAGLGGAGGGDVEERGGRGEPGFEPLDRGA
jgi:hypothetical protein